MPFSMVVRAAEEGGADVVLGGSAAKGRDSRDWRDLPEGVARDLDALPGWVDRALA